MAKKRRKKKQMVQAFKLDYALLGMLFAMVFSFFSWGFIGVFLSNVVRIFVGDGFQIVSLIVFLYALYALVKRQYKLPIAWRQALGLVLLSCTLLIVLTLFSFSNSQSVLNDVWKEIRSDLLANQVLRSAGGGIIGALLTQSIQFLFGQVGAYLIVMLISIISALLFMNRSILDVFSFIGDRVHLTLPRKKSLSIKTVKNNVSKVLLSQEEPDTVVSESKVLFKELDDDIQENELIINGFQSNDESVSDSQVDQLESTEEEVIEDTQEMSVSFKTNQDDSHYQLPPITLLNQVEATDQSTEFDLIKRNSKVLEETFKSFGVSARVISANLGPSVTKFEVQPAVGVKVSKIVNLADDLALALAAKDIRIEAPIPGKSYVGIEVPNQTTSMVSFREIIEGNIDSPSKLEVPLGRDISGNIRLADLSKMPHLLVAGATGSGKSVAVNGMIISILMKAKPTEVKLMMIDPKKVELSTYNGIPHLLTPVVTNPRRAAQALQKVVMEMERRYELFAQTGMKNITSYNEHVDSHNQQSEEKWQRMPYIVVIVDELADLMMVASNEVESAIIRLAQMARAAGIHMVLATQRPSVDVITGLIKANVPSRMAFAVSSSIDSRTIIDGNGAEKLLGKGDMLFMPMGENKPVRVQGAFLSDREVESVVSFVKKQQEAHYVEEMMPTDEDPVSGAQDSEDELFDEVVAFLREQEYMSVSMLQRRFRIGFNRAARLMEDLEAKGIVGKAEGTKPRRVLINES